MGEEEEEDFIQNRHARGAIPNEVGPVRGRATREEEEEEKGEEEFIREYRLSCHCVARSGGV